LNKSWQRHLGTGTTAAWLTVLFKYRRGDTCGCKHDCGGQTIGTGADDRCGWVVHMFHQKPLGWYREVHQTPHLCLATFIENVALQGNPFASQVRHAAPDSSEAIHTQEAAA
jgi:hypothetical protein